MKGSCIWRLIWPGNTTIQRQWWSASFLLVSLQSHAHRNVLFPQLYVTSIWKPLCFGISRAVNNQSWGKVSKHSMVLSQQPFHGFPCGGWCLLPPVSVWKDYCGKSKLRKIHLSMSQPCSMQADKAILVFKSSVWYGLLLPFKAVWSFQLFQLDFGRG